jgi:ribosomal protein S20
MNGVNRFGRGILGSMVCVALVAAPIAPVLAQGKRAAAAAKDAKPSKATREKAREAYKKGEEKFGAGDFAGAAEAYKSANELIPSAQATYKMALSLDKAGKTEALGAYQSFLATPPPDNMGEQKAAAEKRVAEMGKGSIKITTTPPGASIKIDGERSLDASPTTIAVKPGVHKVEATLADHESASQDVTVPAGGTVDVALTLKNAPAAAVAVAPPPAPPPAASEPPPAPPPPPAEPKSKVPAYVTLGIGGVGAIVGTIFGLGALSAKSDFKSNPTTDNADKAERNALIADMSFGVALTLGITGTVLLLSADKPADPPKAGALRFAPLLSRDTQGAAAQIRF